MSVPCMGFMKASGLYPMGKALRLSGFQRSLQDWLLRADLQWNLQRSGAVGVEIVDADAQVDLPGRKIEGEPERDSGGHNLLHHSICEAELEQMLIEIHGLPIGVVTHDGQLESGLVAAIRFGVEGEAVRVESQVDDIAMRRPFESHLARGRAGNAGSLEQWVGGGHDARLKENLRGRRRVVRKGGDELL